MKIKHKLTFFERSRRLFWYFIVTLLVVSAISMTLARTLISNVGGLRDKLEMIASDYLEQPIKIETFDAKIIGFTPTFIFKNVSLLERNSNKVMVRFKEARIGLSLYNSIKKIELSPKSFVISGINLVVTQNKNNTFKVKGINVAEFDPSKHVDSTESSELSNWLFQQDKLKLENSTIHWYNANTRKVIKFSNINLLFHNNKKRHTLSGDWQLQGKLAKRFKIELDMTGDILNPASWEGLAYVKGEEVNISKFGIPANIIPLKQASGIYNFELWADYKLGQLKEISGATNVRNLKFNSSKFNKTINVDKLGAVWRWDNLADGWALNIDRFYYEVNNKIWPLTRVLVENHHRFQPDSIIDIYADKFNIADLSGFVQKLNIVKKEEINRIKKINPGGLFTDAHIRFNASNAFSNEFVFQSNFSNLTSNPAEFIPGVSNLSGSISTTNNSGAMVINSVDSAIKFSNLFRDEIKVSNFSGRLDWRKINKEWHLWGNDLNESNNDIKLNSNLYLIFPGDKASPLIDLQVNFKDGDIAKAKNYYPVSIMDKELVEWLDKSLESGFVKTGGVVLQGRLADFPYLENQGKFEVSLESENFVLNYLNKWPKIRDASASMTFTGSGLNINISKSNILDSFVNNTTVEINNYFEPELVIKGNVSSSTADIFNFLVNSPIASDSKSLFSKFKISGNSKVYLQINVPLSESMEKIQKTYYKGSIITSDSSFSPYRNILKFTHINGQLDFDENGFTSKKLEAISFNQPASIQVYTQSKEKSYSQHIVIQGKFSAESIRERLKIPWMEKSAGVTNWQGIFNFPYSTSEQDIPSSFVVTTDFQGINLKLPMPLLKEKEDKLPISIESKFISDELNEINISINDNIMLRNLIAFSNKGFNLKSSEISFNSENKHKLQDGLIFIRGHIRDIDFTSWSEFIKDFKFSNHKTDNVFISPDLNVVFDVDSFIIDVNEKQSLVKDEIEKTKLVQSNAVDPRVVPEFRGEIRNIVYDKSLIGDLSFDFKHTRNGFDIKKLNLVSNNFKITSTGIWHIYPYKNQDRFLTKLMNVKFISSDLGATLASLGFKSVLNKGKSNTDLTLWWHDSPFKFSPEKLSAEIFVNVSDGEILDIDPKAGRLLGLLSLSSLPKRLFGDFSDIFSSGLSFDSVIGEVRIANGIMSSKDLLMKSSLAEIHISGQSDLVKREFDQKIEVIPNITDTTAVLGGLLGGVPTLIITKILGSIINLNEAETRTYNVTGTWEKPVITSLSEPVENLNSSEDEFIDEE
ncbi:MAG: YhdP family protein [Gammaproteobacteria bacterium]